MRKNTSTESTPPEAESSDVSTGVMDTELPDDRLAPNENTLLRALDLLSVDQFGQVVEDVLKAPRTGDLKSARQSLDAAMDACEFIEIKGVRSGKTSKASPAQLKLPVVEECGLYENVRLLGALLRVWRLSKTRLREKVEDHLKEAGISAGSVNFRDGCYHGLWRPEDWESHTASLIESDKGSGESEDSGLAVAEIRLMLSLVSGASPARPGEMSASRFEDPLLARFLAQLWTFSPNDPIWAELDNFIEELGELNDSKSREMIESRITTGKQRLEELESSHRESLSYLECDLGRIRSAIDENAELMLCAGDDYYPDLIEALNEYKLVRDRGDTKSEENDRAAKRAPLEDKIVNLVTQWESKIGNLQSKLREEESAADESPATEELPMDEDLLALRNRLQAETLKRKEFQSRIETQSAELRNLRQLFRNAESKNKKLREENLEIEEAMEAASRNSTAVDGENSDGCLVAYPAHWIEDVKDAVEQAKRSFEDHLVFALNAKSQQNSAFEKPEEVFGALAWLAKYLRVSKLNPDIGVNLNEALDKSLKKAVRPNWFYTPRQSPTATGKHPDSYTASHQGTKYDLHEHIGRGKSHSAKGSIRIAFAWDEKKRKLIVGYIGRHQPTGRS